MTKFAKFYLALAFVAIGGFVYAAKTGWEPSSPKERFIPKEVVRSPNGIRAFHFWHVGYGGYRGGK